MKKFSDIIHEWKYDDNSNVDPYLHPKTKQDLIEILADRLRVNIEEPNMSFIDTSAITDMSNIFAASGQQPLRKLKLMPNRIKKLDLSGWDVSNVTKMDNMFFMCTSLEEIVGIDKWNVEKLESCQSMFYDCYTLYKMNINNWNIQTNTNTTCMFQDCNYFSIPKWYNVETQQVDFKK